MGQARTLEVARSVTTGAREYGARKQVALESEVYPFMSPIRMALWLVLFSAPTAAVLTFLRGVLVSEFRLSENVITLLRDQRYQNPL